MATWTPGRSYSSTDPSRGSLALGHGGCATEGARAYSFSRIRLFATPWIGACQSPLSVDFPGKNTGVGCHFLLQGSSRARDRPRISCVSCIVGGFFAHRACGKRTSKHPATSAQSILPATAQALQPRARCAPAEAPPRRQARRESQDGRDHLNVSGERFSRTPSCC